MLTLAAAAAIAVLGAAAGALAVSLGSDRKAAPAVVQPRLVLPHGARGIAAVVDGKLWLTVRSGLRIEGLPVDAAGLSPHAWYVAAGLGHDLVAMAPNGARAWSHPTPGPVAAIAWAPSGLRIAYVVRVGHAFQLRLIEGDGDHDRLVDAAVRPVTPVWLHTSLGVGYVGAGGSPTLYDLGHGKHLVVHALPAAPPLRTVPLGDRHVLAEVR